MRRSLLAGVFLVILLAALPVPGRMVIESCSTKIVPKQHQASQALKEAFNLSDGEETFIINAKIGMHSVLHLPQ
jgi:hypothetical protein